MQIELYAPIWFSPNSLERYHLTPALLRWIRRFRFRLGCSRFHEAADLLRYNSLHMCIGVQGKSGAVVVDSIFTSTPLEKAMVANVWCRL